MSCLIIERHNWETGQREQQLQIPLEAANNFFGPGNRSKDITVIAFDRNNKLGEYDCSISKEYANGTRRINGLPLIGNLGHCLIFMQETNENDTYEFWWENDIPLVTAKYPHWKQAQNSQYGRGRLVIIVDEEIPKVINHI